MFSCNSIGFRVTRTQSETRRAYAERIVPSAKGIAQRRPKAKARYSGVELHAKRAVVPGLESGRAHLRHAPRFED